MAFVAEPSLPRLARRAVPGVRRCTGRRTRTMRVTAGVQESTRAQRKKGHQRSRAGSWTTHTHTHIYSKRVNKPDRPRTQQADPGNDGNKTALRSDVFVSRRGVPVATDSTSQRATFGILHNSATVQNACWHQPAVQSACWHSRQRVQPLTCSFHVCN